MFANDTDFTSRYRTFAFNAGATLGLWALVATGLYVAQEAERANPARLSSLSQKQPEASGERVHSVRSKDDEYTVVALPAGAVSVQLAVALPVARPVRADGGAAPAVRRQDTVAAPPRQVAAAAPAGAERFDRCAPSCESRDPLVADSAPMPAPPVEPLRLAGDVEPDARPIEDVVFHSGRELVGQIVEIPRLALDTGKGLLSTSLVWFEER